MPRLERALERARVAGYFGDLVPEEGDPADKYANWPEIERKARELLGPELPAHLETFIGPDYDKPGFAGTVYDFGFRIDKLVPNRSSK